MNNTTLNDIIVDDPEKGLFQVHRRAFTDRAIFEIEQREIFDRCWLYTAHESELPGPGTFLTRKVADRSLLLTRDDSGVIHAFFNVCAHRANLVCRQPAGEARRFTCYYHGWTYDLKGALIGLPGPDAYAPGFDRAGMGLVSVPRLELYRGLIFISFDKDIMSLVDYLGRAREQLDYVLDFAGDDDLVLASSTSQGYCIKANWKLLAENTVDGYHFLSTHNRYVTQYLPDMGVDNSGWTKGKTLGGAGLDLDNGHMAVEQPQRSTALAGKARDELERIHAELVAKYGPERTRRITEQTRNLFIFPNLFFIAYWRQIRTWYPMAPDYMEVDVWQLMPKHEPAELRQKRMEDFISFLGPAGFGTPDDVAVMEGCQAGFRALPDAWSDNSRGMGRTLNDSNDEFQMRVFWRRWHALMRGEQGPTDCSDRIAAPAAGE